MPLWANTASGQFGFQTCLLTSVKARPVFMCCGFSDLSVNKCQSQTCFCELCCLVLSCVVLSCVLSCVVLSCLVLCEVCCVRCGGVSVGCSRFSWVRPRFGRTPPPSDTASAGRPKISLFLFPSPATFFTLREVFSWKFGGVFEGWDLSNVHVWAFQRGRHSERERERERKNEIFAGEGKNRAKFHVRVGPRRVGGPKFRAFSRHQFRSFSLSLCLLVVFWWCEAPVAPKPLGFHTTAREPKRAHLSAPAFTNTTKIQREDTQ